MAAISQIIPNLMGGVSKQPDPLKLPGQVREAENVFLDPTFGCKKRPPTKFIASIGNGEIPADAQWFPIFRDQKERYMASIYNDPVNGTTIRVWEADTGIERTVNVLDSATDYLKVQTPSNLRPLTINDYTLLANKEREVTMSNNVASPDSQEAIVVVNQIAYNTTYVVDFLKDGNLQQEKVWRASKLTIEPGSFEEEGDNGACALAGTTSFVEDHPSDPSKVGLGFSIQTTCNPTLVTTEVPGKFYPVGARTIMAYEDTPLYDSQGFKWRVNAYLTEKLGKASNYVKGSYLYHTFTTTTPYGDITIRCEFRVVGDDEKTSYRYEAVSAQVASYTLVDSTPWKEDIIVTDSFISSGYDMADGLHIPSGEKVGIIVRITRVSQGASSNDYSYKSVYKVKVSLNNGGSGWRKGDTITVNSNGKDYTVRVEEETFGFAYLAEASVSYTSPADTTNGQLDVGAIVADLTTDINNLGPYTASPIGNVIHIKRNDGREFNIQTRGGAAERALTGIKGAVNDLSQLPEQCIPGITLRVRNSADYASDDYYVKFVSEDGDIPGQGSWEETVAPGIPTDLNPSTMPHALIREADGTFTLRPLTRKYDDALYWAGREVGDEETNPTPTFVGQKIVDVFFYQNRLGFLSGDSVVMSQPGDFFNFFQGSSIAVADSDPIDMTASSTKPAALKAAVGTTRGLIIFAENSQFLMATDEPVFGPSTVKITEISSYSYNSKVAPLETGVSVIFSTEADTYTKVFEMAVDSVDNRPLVSENTRIIPDYIPNGLTWATSSPNNSFVMFGNDSKSIWTFKFYNNGNERVLAGWSKWLLPAEVRQCAFDHDTGFMVLYNDPFKNDTPPGSHVQDPSYILVKFEMLDDPNTSPITAKGKKFVPRLDSYLLKSELTVESTADPDTYNLRFPDGAYIEYVQPNVIVTVDGEATLFQRPEIKSDANGYYVEVPKDVVDLDLIMGLEYNLKVELPSFYVTVNEKTDRKNLPIVEMAYIDLYFSGRYIATTHKVGYSDRTVDLDVTTADIYSANAPAVEEVVTRPIPIFCRGDQVYLTIESPDPLPSSVTGYSWEGHYNNRGISFR